MAIRCGRTAVLAASRPGRLRHRDGETIRQGFSRSRPGTSRALTSVVTGTALWPKSVLWIEDAQRRSAVYRDHPTLGKAYHVATPRRCSSCSDLEDGYWYHAHPRTKGTAGYPDAIWDRPYIKNDRYLGVAYKMGMGIDLS